MPRFRLLISGGVAGALLLSACSSTATTSTSGSTTAAPTTQAPGTTMAKTQSIVATAVAAGQFKTLAKLLTSAGLVETLSGTAPFTVFAPTDDAFAKVDPALLEALGKDPAKLKEVLTYHVVSGTVMAKDVKAGEVPTVQGEKIKVSIQGSTVMVNTAKVVKTDITASNGVIHVIDAVLMPPSMAK